MLSQFRDPADSRRASFSPDIAGEIDRPEEVLAEILEKALERWKGDLPRTVQEFRSVVAGLAIGAIREAGEEGALEELFGEAEVPRSDVETARLMVAEILGDQNPRLQAKCIDFVWGFGLIEERTEKEIGENEGVGKAAVSKRCIQLCEIFRLPKVHGMKDEDARESYRKRQMGKRARPAPEPWAFKGLIGRACGV